MRKPVLIATLGLSLFCVLALSAAPPRATLTGLVLNTRGMPVKSAQVFWQTADGTDPHILHTDSEGRFRISPLREGLYDFRAEAAGMWSEWEHNIMVRKGADVSVTLRLLRKTPPSSTASSKLHAPRVN